MSQYKLHEIVEGCNFTSHPERNGMEAEIIGPLQMRAAFNRQLGISSKERRYLVKWKDGNVTAQSPYCLRRKPIGEARIFEMFRTAAEGSSA